MVLGDLGGRIASALKKLQSASVIDEKALDDCLKEVATALLYADVNVRLVQALREDVRKSVVLQDTTGGFNERKMIQKAVVEALVRMLTPGRSPPELKKGRCSVVMFVGLQGSGKTTTCTKFAYYYKKKGWKPAIVCADTFRAGAFDQVKQNCTKVRIPFYGSETESDPAKIAADGVEIFRQDKRDMIIVDTSGRHKQEAGLFEEMIEIAAVVNPQDVVYVMDSHIGQACFDQATAFTSAVSVGSCIITKLDGHAKGGGALSAVAATQAPIIFVGTGEAFDEFEHFQPRNFVQRLLGLGDVTGLLSTIRDAVPLENQQELQERLSKGQFTLKDMYDQFENVLRMGSLNKLMSMLPGVGQQQLIPKGHEQEGVARIRRFLTIMDSMTKGEMDCSKPMVESRILRVARGSGSQLWEVRMLLDQYKQFSKMIDQWARMGLAKKGPGDLQNIIRNPNQAMQRMQRQMPPQLLRQMGGPQNMLSMMKEMKDNPEFKDMLQGMGEGGGGGGRKGRRK